MSKVWKFNLFLMAVVVIAIFSLMKDKKSEVVTPDPIPVVEVQPSVEIVEEAESIYGYTSVGETPPGESETVYLTKAITVTNPHDFPVIIGGVKNDTYDTSDSLISSEDRFGFVPRRTIAPGGVVHIAATDFLSKIHSARITVLARLRL